MTVATSRAAAARTSSSRRFYNGPLMLTLDDKKPARDRAVEGQERQRDPDRRPARGDRDAGHRRRLHLRHLQLRPVPLPEGEDRRAVWETQAVTKERARWASGVIVRHGDRLFINNDRGELIIVKPSPKGYQEISRTQLIKPTSPAAEPARARQRELVAPCVREQAHLRAQRRRDHLRVARGGRVTSHDRRCAAAQLLSMAAAAPPAPRSTMMPGLGSATRPRLGMAAGAGVTVSDPDRWRWPGLSVSSSPRATRSSGCRRSTSATSSTSSPAAATRWH